MIALPRLCLRHPPVHGLLAAGWALLLGGCVVMDDDAKQPIEGSPQSETVTFSEPDADPEDTGELGTVDPIEVSVTWGAESVTVQVAGGGSWQLGMAETGGSCGASVPCWTGEDCHRGYTAADGTSLGPYCHAVADGRVALAYGGDLTDLEEGTTVFQEAFQGTVTYVLTSNDEDGPCLVFGDKPDYYDSLGCSTLAR